MTSNVFSYSWLRRYTRFLSVAAIGLGIQPWTLLLLLQLGVEPVLASLLAVEAAMLTNFPMHRSWTWSDRPASGISEELRRLGRFHISNGVTSLFGHAAMVPICIYSFALTPLAANLISIGVCGVANFLLADLYAFGAPCAASVRSGSLRGTRRRQVDLRQGGGGVGGGC